MSHLSVMSDPLVYAKTHDPRGSEKHTEDATPSKQRFYDVIYQFILCTCKFYRHTSRKRMLKEHVCLAKLSVYSHIQTKTHYISKPMNSKS